jgi:predicted ATPase
LTQQVADNSLLVERRRAIHEKTANAIEALFSGRLEDHYTELAYHFLRSADTAEAIRYAQLAAEQAVNRAVYSEASNLIESSLRLLDRLPEGSERIRREFALEEQWPRPAAAGKAGLGRAAQKPDWLVERAGFELPRPVIVKVDF